MMLLIPWPLVPPDLLFSSGLDLHPISAICSHGHYQYLWLLHKPSISCLPVPENKLTPTQLKLLSSRSPCSSMLLHTVVALHLFTQPPSSTEIAAQSSSLIPFLQWLPGHPFSGFSSHLTVHYFFLGYLLLYLHALNVGGPRTQSPGPLLYLHSVPWWSQPAS